MRNTGKSSKRRTIRPIFVITESYDIFSRMHTFQQFIEKLFGIDHKTSSTIFITLLVFIAGQLIVVVTGIINRISKRTATRRIFFNVVSDAVRITHKLSRIHAETSETIRKEEFSISKAEFYPSSVLPEIGFSKLFESLFFGVDNLAGGRQCKKKVKIRSLTKIWELIRVIKFWEDKSFDGIPIFMGKLAEYNEKRNESFQKFNDLCDIKVLDIVVKINNHEELDPKLEEFVRRLSVIKEKWTNEADYTNVNVSQLHFVEPAINLCNEYPSLPLPIELVNLLNVTTGWYINRQVLLKTSTQQYLTYSRDFSRYSRLLKKCLKILR
jgi:hypothetical protein